MRPSAESPVHDSPVPPAQDLSLQQYAYAALVTPGILVNPLDHYPAAPAVNGWTAACIFTLGRKLDPLCEKLLQSKFPRSFMSESILVPTPDVDGKMATFKVANHALDKLYDSHKGVLNKSHVMRLWSSSLNRTDGDCVEVKFVTKKPCLRTIPEANFERYFVLYNPKLDNSRLSIIVPSAPVFFLTRLGLVTLYEIKDSRWMLWIQMLIYSSSVKSLEDEDLKSQFYLEDKEAWVSFIATNHAYPTVGFETLERIQLWLNKVENGGVRENQLQEFKHVAKVWFPGKEEDQEKLVDRLKILRGYLRVWITGIYEGVATRLNEHLSQHTHSLASRPHSRYFPQARKAQVILS
ncbi:hypothetical protein JCM3765_002036 [Sporobolomyces pararoseus]